MNDITVLSETLALIERVDGFWLWDETRQMNLSVKAKTKESALVEALMYYQRRLLRIEKAYEKLDAAVAAFGAKIVEIHEEDEKP